MKDYTTLLGDFFYASQEVLLARWSSLSDESQEGFLKRLFKDGFSSWAVHKLGVHNIPKQFADVARANMQRDMLHALRDEAALRQLYALFEREKIRFIPIKGIDLTYRVYASPSLRPFGDWDIFFHPDDIDRARQLLIDNGWKEILEQSKELHHHYSPLIKDKHFLEPHWTLSCCMNAAPEVVWNLSNAIDGTTYRRALSPEVNLLLIARHAAEDLYQSVNLTKMLLDAASIIAKEPVDWRKGRQVSTKLKQPYFGNLFAAFPEFFPTELIQTMEGTPEQVMAFRQVFEQRKQFGKLSGADVMMQSESRFSKVWFKRILRVFLPKNLRYKYGLPEHGAAFRLMLCYPHECWAKCSQLFCHLSKDQSALEAYCRLIKTAEK